MPEDKAWIEKNLSGLYNFVEMVNDGPAYKVRPLHFAVTGFKLSFFIFSVDEELMTAKKFIFGII